MARCAYKSILKELEKCRRELLSGSAGAMGIMDKLIDELKERIAKEENRDPRVRELLYFAYGRYQEEVGTPMAADYGADGARVKRILKKLKPLAKEEEMEEEELFKILWDFFVNRYPKARKGGIGRFEAMVQNVYEYWKKEVSAPIDFGEGDVATNPKFGVSKEFNTKIELTESED